MVFFSCDGCGASLKKNQVEKHRYSCYGTLCCIDCNKDFPGNEYVNHTKCISEIERYSAKGWKPPTNFNKGEKKQQAWVDLVQNVVQNAGTTLKPATRNLLLAISKHDNVPRKKPKLINFVQNVTRRAFDLRTIEEVWDLLEVEWNKSKKPEEKPKEIQTESATNGNSIEEPETESAPKKDKKKKKKKTLEVEEGEQEDKPNGIQLEADSELNSGTNGNSIEEPESGSKKDKKKKKKRAIEVEVEEAEQELVGVENLEEQPSSPKKKKKKRTLEVEEAEQEQVLGVENLEEQPTPKKKKKKSKI